MAKRSVPVVIAADDGMRSYRVADGVTHLNGRRVTEQTVRLTSEQALYDLAVGRITPVIDDSATGDGA